MSEGTAVDNSDLIGAKKQPELTVDQKTFTPGMLDGKPVVVIYDAVTDKTQVIAPQSKWYPQAIAALGVLVAASTPVQKLEQRTVLHAPKRPRIIRPGMQ